MSVARTGPYEVGVASTVMGVATVTATANYADATVAITPTDADGVAWGVSSR